MDLEVAARAALTTRNKRVLALAHAGQRYFAKRLAAPKQRETRFARWAIERVTGFAPPAITPELLATARRVDFEPRRIATLAAAGVRVPRIVVEAADLIVLEDCGTDTAALLETWSPDTWRREFTRLAGELGEFHRAGHWHGAAQIKNVALRDGVSYRFDFEESHGLFLPLPVTQAADLVQFLNTIALAGPIVESEARVLLPQLLDRYMTVNPNPDLKHAFRSGRPLLRMGVGVARLFEPWSRKGVRRALIQADVIARV